jgi:hypothetical protein
MSYAPYDPDADIFSDEEIEEERSAEEDPKLDTGHKHTIDGSTCPTCQVEHPNIAGDIDPRALEAFLTFLDAMPPSLVHEMLESEISGGKNKRPQAEMLTGFMSYAEKMDNVGTSTPVMRAVVEYLDEQTDGRISRRWKVYESERRLVVTHHMHNSARLAMEEATEEGAEPNKHFLGLLEMIIDYTTERMELVRQKYYEACAEAGYEPDQLIIEEGKYNYPEEYNSVMEELHRELTIR